MPLSKPRVLVADERAIFRSGMRHILEAFGYRVDEVADALAITAAMQADDFDLVVIDAHEPISCSTANVLAVRLESAVPILLLAQRHQHLPFPCEGTTCAIARPFALEDFMDAVAEATKHAKPRRSALESAAARDV